MTNYVCYQNFLGAFGSHTPSSAGHIKRWQNSLDLALPTQIKSSSTPSSTNPFINSPSRWNILLYLNDNTLHNIYVVEYLIQLIVGSNEEIVANSHWTEHFTLDFSLDTLKLLHPFLIEPVHKTT